MCQCRRSWRKSLRLSLAGARRQHGWTCMPARRTVPGRGENGRSPRRGTAGGCRALRRRSVDITAGGPTGVHNLCKTHATISSFRPFFFWRFLLISLLCCLFCIVSQAARILFVRSASRWSIHDEQGQIILRFPAPRLLFNGAHFHSPQVRGFPRLLHCEQFVQQSR